MGMYSVVRENSPLVIQMVEQQRKYLYAAVLTVIMEQQTALNRRIAFELDILSSG